MRPLLALLMITLLAGSLAACEVLGPDQGAVSARSIGAALFLTNKTEARIYYFVVGRETAALINWAPHLGLEKSVGRSATGRIAHEAIFRSETEQEVIVYWWHADGEQGQRQPGPIQSFVIGL